MWYGNGFGERGKEYLRFGGLCGEEEDGRRQQTYMKKKATRRKKKKKQTSTVNEEMRNLCCTVWFHVVT